MGNGFEPTFPENDATILRTIIGLREDAELPQRIVEKYWELKRILDRISAGVRPHDLAWICMLAGHGKPNEKESRGPTVADLFRAKKVQYDDRVSATFRNERRPGVFRGLMGDGSVRIQLDGDTEERGFPDADVRLEAVESVTTA